MGSELKIFSFFTEKHFLGGRMESIFYENDMEAT